MLWTCKQGVQQSPTKNSTSLTSPWIQVKWEQSSWRYYNESAMLTTMRKHE